MKLNIYDMAYDENIIRGHIMEEYLYVLFDPRDQLITLMKVLKKEINIEIKSYNRKRYIIKLLQLKTTSQKDFIEERRKVLNIESKENMKMVVIATAKMMNEASEIIDEKMYKELLDEHIYKEELIKKERKKLTSRMIELTKQGLYADVKMKNNIFSDYGTIKGGRMHCISCGHTHNIANCLYDLKVYNCWRCNSYKCNDCINSNQKNKCCCFTCNYEIEQAKNKIIVKGKKPEV